MVHLAPLLREIVPGGFARLCLFDRAGEMRAVFNESERNQQLAAAHVAEVVPDPLSPMAQVRAAWAGRRQGVYLALAEAYRQTPFFEAVEGRSDVDQVLDMMVHADAPPVAGLQITRPRASKQFTSADIARLDTLRAHLAVALASPAPIGAGEPGANGEGCATSEQALLSGVPGLGGPVLCGIALIGPDDRLREVSREFTAVLRLIDGRPWRAFGLGLATALPPPCREVIQRVRRVGPDSAPPAKAFATPWGRLEVRARLLTPVGASPDDAAGDPAGLTVALQVGLTPSTLARAWRDLRERDASPTQAAVGARLLAGRRKGAIARELGVERTSVEDAARKLFARMDVHSVAELDQRIDGTA